MSALVRHDDAHVILRVGRLRLQYVSYCVDENMVCVYAIVTIACENRGQNRLYMASLQSQCHIRASVVLCSPLHVFFL